MNLKDRLKDPNILQSKNFINGRWVDSNHSNKKISVFNPSTNEKIGSVPNMNGKTIDEIVLFSNDAGANFKNYTAKERADLLFRFRKQIIDNKDDLAIIITAESGKPIAESYAEIASSANTIEWFAEEVKRMYGETIPSHANSKRIMTIKQPIGTVAAITPWNFPSSMITRKCAPALAAGCPIIIKPAPETPFSALALAYLSEKAGFPPGIFNVITGDAEEIGKSICANNDIRMLSFTGSTKVGKILLEQSAKTIKRVTLELGGNAPFIIFDDANIDKAVEGTIMSKFRNSGQTCISANRILVDNKIYPIYLEKLMKRVKLLKLGDGFDPKVQISALINKRAVDNAEGYIQDALDKGAKCVLGGKKRDGLFFEPTIIVDVCESMDINNKELFSPIIAITTFDTEKEAINLANNTEYGLAGYFYSKNISRIYKVAEALETGMVGINTGMISTEIAPFGGVKQSGLGREGSKYGIEEYLEIKYLCLDIEN